MLWSLDTSDFAGTLGPTTTTPVYDWIEPYIAHPGNLYCPEDTNQIFYISYGMGELIQFPSCYLDPAHHLLEGVP
jgi:hypothetical protein